MVQALVQLDENTNRVLNIVKAKYGLKDKGEAIQVVVQEYIEKENKQELRPEYLEKLKKLERQKGIPFGNIAELRKIIER